MEQNIKDAIESIRPFLQRDGGDIEFVEYTADNIVKSSCREPATAVRERR